MNSSTSSQGGAGLTTGQPDAVIRAPQSGTDESIGEGARMPFDTPRGGSSGAPPVVVDNPHATVALFVMPPPSQVTPATLDAETRNIEAGACTRLTELQKRLSIFQQALQRLQATASSSELDLCLPETQFGLAKGSESVDARPHDRGSDFASKRPGFAVQVEGSA
jgi:hypothetical protein